MDSDTLSLLAAIEALAALRDDVTDALLIAAALEAEDLDDDTDARTPSRDALKAAPASAAASLLDVMEA